LSINVDDKNLSSKTVIPYAVALDSSWFEVSNGLDSLGLMYHFLTDPIAPGNYYRFYYQRTNKHTFRDAAGQVKDPFPIAPFYSVLDDKFTNGKSFEIFSDRGEIGNIERQDDEGPEEGYFKIGDTVIVKFCAITR